jgi:hypothetical protein
MFWAQPKNCAAAKTRKHLILLVAGRDFESYAAHVGWRFLSTLYRRNRSRRFNRRLTKHLIIKLNFYLIRVAQLERGFDSTYRLFPIPR